MIFAAIRFKTPDEGGRPSPEFTGDRYSTVMEFEDERHNNYRDSSWSLIVDFTSPPVPAGQFRIAKVWFLSPEGPAHRLGIGERFYLKEGARVTVTGVVLAVE